MSKILTPNIIKDTKTNLEALNYIIPKDIKCIETDTDNFKIGNGSDTYPDLNYGSVEPIYLPNTELDKETKLLELQNGKQKYGILKKFDFSTFDYITVELDSNLVSNYSADVSSLAVDDNKSYVLFTNNDSNQYRFPVNSAQINNSDNTIYNSMSIAFKNTSDQLRLRGYFTNNIIAMSIYVFITYTKSIDPILSGSLLSLFDINIYNSLINRPDKWEPWVEYDFGDNLYGQRYTGTITIAATTTGTDNINGIILMSNVNCRVIGYGGWWYDGSGSCLGINGSINWYPRNCSQIYIEILSEDLCNINFHSMSNYQRTNAPYDIWIKYIKL